MRTRSFPLVMLVLAGALVGAVTSASAQTACQTGQTGQYPPSAPGLQVSVSEVPPGGSFTITGGCFLPNATVTLEFRSVPVSLGSAQTNAQGTFSRTVTIPRDATPGQHSVVATDGKNSLTASIFVSGVSGENLNKSGALPRTGSSSTVPLGAAGLGLIGAGSLAVLAVRRKRALVT